MMLSPVGQQIINEFSLLKMSLIHPIGLACLSLVGDKGLVTFLQEGV